MEADFSGYVTKAKLRCSDGRTIMPDAFAHQDGTKVPLVWQHGHTDPENVLGHVHLENRPDGVYGYAFFNKTGKAAHARELVEHKDINQMSIWANNLRENAKVVLHGAIREVSLVLAGANPGALIENVNIRHADGTEDVLDDEVIIYTGLSLHHGDESEVDQGTAANDAGEGAEGQNGGTDDGVQNTETTGGGEGVQGEQTAEGDENNGGQADGGDATSEKSPAEVVETMNEEQKDVLHFLVDRALSASMDDDGNLISHASDDLSEDATVQDVIDSMNKTQKDLLYYLVGAAEAAAKGEIGAQHSNLGENNNDSDDANNQKGEMMHRNVFEGTADSDKKEATVLSHDDMKSILTEAKEAGSFKAAIEGYALAHGIEDIDVLFPEARAVDAVPEYLKRQNEWVSIFLGRARKSPFSKIKTLSADLTEADARAKGYIKGSLKKEEFFKVAKRTTSPTTVYKKQKLDREDIIDITDFDVVGWLKAEMRVMLDEEIARAGLLGDGREADDPDKINEESIRPIVSDHELYATKVFVNLGDANSNISELEDAIVMNRSKLKGTGMPIFFTTETVIGRFLISRDSLGRKIFKSLDEVATQLRVSEIVPVEPMEEYPDILGVLVNPVDYTYGATKGGEVTTFSDFDIDYNQEKYLTETRCSGTLTKLKSALVLIRTADNSVLVTPAAPAFDPETGTLTITDQTGVVYKNQAGTTLTNVGGPYDVPSGTTWTVTATPASGYNFATSDDDQWNFTAD